ncbi:MAG: M28 family peptidase [Oscillospiraceae bacterium]|nr:M28 family peptidase [Oscillospiraceae bacterium]
MNTYQYDLVQKMSFIRNGGTDEELQVANMLLAEIEAAGGKGEIENFEIPAYKFEKYSMKVVAPYEMEIETIPYGLSGCLPEGGVDLKFMYAGRGEKEDYVGITDLSDTVVMINEMNFDAYKLLCEKNAAAFMVIQGKWYQNSENWGFLERHLREKFLENGKIPGFYIWAKDATELVRNHAETIHLELQQTELTNTSRNVVATIPGTDDNGESIVITAHYDSVLIGTGSWDNATGAATIMYIYRHFMKNPPKRTLRFVWCGSEEQGLLGSKAYVAQHPDLVENEIAMCFNFDMCGTVLGPNSVFVTGGEDLKHFAEQYNREIGMSAAIRHMVHSSDSAPFADKGIPSLGLSRGTKTCDIHTCFDLMFPLSAEQLVKDGEWAIGFISRAANAVVLPVEKGMPEDMRKQLDKYFQRDKVPFKKEK